MQRPAALLALLLLARASSLSQWTMTRTPVEIALRPATAGEIPALYALEAASYPADEACSREGLAVRQRDAGAYFRVVEVDGGVVGFVCGTKCAAFTEASMAAHDPAGTILAIHSVVVAPAWRRRGVATDAVARYVAEARARGDVRTVELIAKARLLPLYVGAGFRVAGLSPIVHGADPWFLCAADATVVPCAVVDAFSASAFGGNPAAVVFGAGGGGGAAAAAWMTRAAAEFAVSETAFLDKTGAATYDIRWFTPTTEVDLCGHATLAAAHAVFEADPRLDRVAFRSRASGDLVARRVAAGVELDFPRDEAVADVDDGGELLAAVRAIVGACGAPVRVTGQRDLVVEVPLGAIASMAPDLAAIRRLSETRGFRGVCVCARGDARAAGGADFSSRWFGPAVGIDEDPVTGSAHCALAPLFAEAGQTALVGYQASPRGGVVACGLATPGRVTLSGAATTVIRGTVRTGGSPAGGS